METCNKWGARSIFTVRRMKMTTTAAQQTGMKQQEFEKLFSPR